MKMRALRARARFNPAALHCHWVSFEAQGAASDQINRCKLMLVTERAHNVARAFPSRALACGTAAIGVAAAAWARALFIEHNVEPLSEESSGAFRRSLATFGQGSTALSHLAHLSYPLRCVRL